MKLTDAEKLRLAEQDRDRYRAALERIAEASSARHFRGSTYSDLNLREAAAYARRVLEGDPA